MRFQAAQFGGHWALHCHVLAHEDLGMMAKYIIEGEEGTSPAVRSEQRECLIIESGDPCGGDGKNVMAPFTMVAERLERRWRGDPTVLRWQRATNGSSQLNHTSQ